MMALDFNKYAKKRLQRSSRNYDCTLRVYNMTTQSGAYQVLVFGFYNGSDVHFGNDSGYAMFTTNDAGDRVYFAGSDPFMGYKMIEMNPHNLSSYKKIQRCLSGPEIGFWRSNIGDYALQYDEAERLFYIDLNKRLV